ncbi:hypothetical protein K7711_05325 [Nocardia sp. CA2R105]|uniref:hypothetical protein n=1 Tax=Nocardia coffeae TaxID=2873381 RepID=UPI001CA6A1F4|nr:hypothetical protein [Nocardia coffeae]MBY8855892.1 hypothetical protein [Nocardia coffeae]
MLFVPHAVSDMAKKMEPHAEATKGHATGIANAGFEASHTGQDYQEQGKKLASGVNDIVTMLHSWSEASSATVDVLRHAVNTNVSGDQQHASALNSVTDGLA